MKKYFSFIFFSYLTAFVFEFIANTVGDGKLFQNQNAVIFFVLWYGSLYTIFYVIFKNSKIWLPVVTLAIVGPFAEIFIFHRLNIIVDPIIYAIMGFIPFYLYNRFVK
jgi:hypothetical protein